MNLRTLTIGKRLAFGFGLILAATAAMQGMTVAGFSADRESLQRSLKAAAANKDEAAAMQHALLSAAVAMRNMGLHTNVEALQRDEANVKRERALYLASKQHLLDSQLTQDEREPLEKLAAIDSETSAYFKEAVDFAASMSIEQAAAVIVKSIDPLQARAESEIARFVSGQRANAEQATQQAIDAAAASRRLTLLAGLAVIAASAVFAWRLAVSITGPMRAAEQATARVASGDLASAIDTAGHDEAAHLLQALDAMRASLATMVMNVRRNSDSVALASSEIAQGNNDLSVRTEQQASALQQTAASMESLGGAVRNNADNAQQANVLAQGASSVAQKGGTVVDEVVETMRGINDSSRRIADIVGTIDGIAFQTNILALNAAVEAARAGEQGRGFAVVASEVRSLAQRCTAAAKEVKSLIAASVERVERGTILVDRAGATMKDVVGAIGQVTVIMGEISGASAAQRSGVEQVGHAVSQMDTATQQNAALVEQSAAAAESLKAQANELVRTMAAFKLGESHV